MAEKLTPLPPIKNLPGNGTGVAHHGKYEWIFDAVDGIEIGHWLPFEVSGRRAIIVATSLRQLSRYRRSIPPNLGGLFEKSPFRYEVVTIKNVVYIRKVPNE